MKKPAWRYLNHIDSHAPSKPFLPLMHSCFGKQFVRIVDEGAIKASKFDEVINRSASFFFYGKPSYRPQNGGVFSNNLWSALFTFVLDLRETPLFTSALPFDSGGYSQKFGHHCDNTPIEEYYLATDVEAPGKFVTAFFNNNDNYYKMKLRSDLADSLEALDFHSHSIKQLCDPHGGVNYDQRAGTIEIHFTDEIQLTQKNLLAIVGPHEALDAPDVVDLATRLDAILLPYSLDLNNVDVRQKQVSDEVDRWLQQEGYIL